MDAFLHTQDKTRDVDFYQDNAVCGHLRKSRKQCRCSSEVQDLHMVVEILELENGCCDL